MQPLFYVCNEISPTGEHVVHRDVCPFEAGAGDRDDLGRFENCHMAVLTAFVRGYSSVNGCYYCANKCHVPRHDHHTPHSGASPDPPGSA